MYSAAGFFLPVACLVLAVPSALPLFRSVAHIRGGCGHPNISATHDVSVTRRINILQSCKFRSGVEAIYDIDRTADGLLGKGAFSTVRIARHRRSRQQFAAKIVRLSGLDSKARQRLHREIMILRSLNHPYIVRFHDVFQEDEVIYLILELCTGGELFGFMVGVEMTGDGRRFYTDAAGARRPFGERMAASIARSVAEALRYCHARRICHRDIKVIAPSP